jgi:outer membrane protein assembly factor BamB
MIALTGKELRRYVTGGGIVSSPRVLGNIVYVGSGDGNVYAFHGVHGA